jgi:hypothetical protein
VHARTPQRIRLYVEHFSIPPMATVVGTLEAVFRDNLSGYMLELIAERTKPPGGTVQVEEFFFRVMQRTQDLLPGRNEAAFALCVAPIFVEFHGTHGLSRYNVIAVAARSVTGNEWLFSQFVEPQVPLPLLEALTARIDSVLERRGALTSDPPYDESARAAALTTLAAAAVDHALGKLLSDHSWRN